LLNLSKIIAPNVGQAGDIESLHLRLAGMMFDVSDAAPDFGGASTLRGLKKPF
jgi:hypothetical protein